MGFCYVSGKISREIPSEGNLPYKGKPLNSLYGPPCVIDSDLFPSYVFVTSEDDENFIFQETKEWKGGGMKVANTHSFPTNFPTYITNTIATK